MKLQQLKYVREIVRSGMKISEAAKSLHTAQPSISKQIRLLEDEFQLEIFQRHGKHLTGLTAFGEQLLGRTELIFQQVEQIKAIADDHLHPEAGRLKIATTHTQARFALPGPVQEFRRHYPQIELDIYQGTPDQLVGLSRDMDLIIATEGLEGFDGLRLPCYHWSRDVLVPVGHPLTRIKKLTLKEIAEYPLITYVFSADRSSFIDDSFGALGFHPRIALSAADTDVIKTYVRLGLGVGIIARMAYQPDDDQGLVALDASHLFPTSLTEIGIRPNRFMRRYIYDFINYFSPHLKPDEVEQAVLTGSTDKLVNSLKSLETR
ncbi:MAG: transcriptional regulator CysB [Gammaproteobacteria bacterium]|nr:MAG: transcriptional regulator CysB [Gammaproteobacteria bacterium]RLA10748.1 MAG: transcriptional regulator CysB [Gammaproteobacteria bacterium]RLA13679.1 MAG: transcriptional regulator CysB [Gammaproteobacteria bacterium]